MNTKVDFYFAKSKKWQQELEKLRSIILNCGLEEELKWGTPCYTFTSGKEPIGRSIFEIYSYAGQAVIYFLY